MVTPARLGMLIPRISPRWPRESVDSRSREASAGGRRATLVDSFGLEWRGGAEGGGRLRHAISY